jgi:hypothetical protein
MILVAGWLFMDQDELLMKEYEAVTTLIVHWDKFFYDVSNFYVTIESALLAFVIIRLSAELVDGKPLPMELIPWSIFIALFNLFLCYTWFRAIRSCREYLKVTFKRALKIEEDLASIGVIKLYHFIENELKQAKYIKHSGGWWEVNVPILFMIAWGTGLILVAFDSHDLAASIIVGAAIFIAIVAIIVVEKTAWPQIGRQMPRS